MRIVSVDEMRALEAAAFRDGTTEAQLQLRAAHAVADAVARLRGPGEVVALVGPGNNGRDAFLAVRDLLGRGWQGGLFLSPRHTIADAELRDFVQAGGRVVWCAEKDCGLSVEAALVHATVALDGLLGIGAHGAPRSPLAEIIEALTSQRVTYPERLVVAIDSPSGLDADAGLVPGAAVVADATVVLGGAKRGLLTPSASEYTGELFFEDIGLPDGPLDAPELISASSLRGVLPRPKADAHKGSLGRLLVVAGSERYLGAAFLVCSSAIRAGAGLVTLAAPRWLRDVIATRLPEVTYLPLADGGLAGAPDGSAFAIAEALSGYQALALGPGLSMEGATGRSVELILRRRAEIGLPAVVDADGLNALAQIPDWPGWMGDGVVLTPHIGELSRLVPGVRTEAPWATVQEISRNWSATLLLKGPFTAIGHHGRSWVHARPNPRLATAGTGDVLTGLIGGLLARGLSPVDAACLGVWAHGEAAARVPVRASLGGLMASDLVPQIPGVLADTGPGGS